jgi:hypothetical protein
MAESTFQPILDVLGLPWTPPPAESPTEAHALVTAWLDGSLSASMRWYCPRTDFAARLNTLIDEPWRLYQGTYGWCLEAAFLQAMLRRFPASVVRYAVALYDTGAASLGELSVSVDSELVGFDLPRYVRGELPGNVPAKPITYRHADWIMLAGLVDYLHGDGDFRGPINDSNGAPALSTGEAGKLFSECNCFRTVDSVDVEDPASNLPSKVNKAGASVVLIGRMNTLSVGLFAGLPTLRHAVMLTKPIEVVGANLRLTYWSWGEDLPPDYAAIATPQNEFTVTSSPTNLGAVIMDGAFVVAT